MEAEERHLIQEQFAKADRQYTDGAGNLIHSVDTYILRVLPGDISSVIRAVATSELNDQVALGNTPSQILVDNMSASKRVIERAMRRVQLRFQDIAQLLKALNEIYNLLQQITRIQSPPKNSIVARNNFHLMIDNNLVGLMPAALARVNPSNIGPKSVVRIVGPLVDYGRKLFWNPVGTSSKMSFYRVKSRRTNVRFLPVRGASMLSPRFKPYSPRTLRKKANRTSDPAKTLQSMLTGATPPGRVENAGQIVKRIIRRNASYRGLHFTDGWVEYSPAIGWSKLRNARVPAFGVMFARKGQVLGDSDG
jgi:hypothetical protein